MEKTKNNKKPRGVKTFIGGAILTDERVTRQLPFIFFLALLGLIIITNRNRSERTIRQIEVLQVRMSVLRSESITESAKLMEASKPSEVYKKVKEAGIGLKEPIKPPSKLKVGN
ncbi:MAG: hypothetical protein HN778_12125 [Prolixibacteraceae bacterium]|nr:hypothetical protein [Prolixibacteraceae bacterium]MBT6006047.1 hypothetical protein [Prolixibacteraceae bacterium]MBT6997461.1 hypothetical protein [Prolixibacteraceae bacterium]MBT7395573.1 hypothetical protein [Prolixibacteraceae bacterium]